MSVMVEELVKKINELRNPANEQRPTDPDTLIRHTCLLRRARGAQEQYYPSTQEKKAFKEQAKENMKYNQALQTKNIEKNFRQINHKIEKLISALAKNAFARLNFYNYDFTLGAPNTEDALLRALLTSNALTHLNLWNSTISPEGIQTLARLLSANNTLLVLDFSRNLNVGRLGNNEVQAIAQALSNNKTLINLNLKCRGIGNDGAVIIAESLLNNRVLTHLNLGDNEIGDRGAEAIANSLLNNRALTDLDLTGNEIGDRGAEGIANSLLNNNKTLTCLWLGGNEVNRKVWEHIDTLLKRNKTEEKYRKIKKEFYNCKIAFLCGTHERMGENSPILTAYKRKTLSKNIMKKIFEYAEPFELRLQYKK